MSRHRWLITAAIALALLFAVWLVREVRSLPPVSELPQRLAARYAAAGATTWLPLEAISPRLQTAVIVWEDPAFYHHHGINLAAIRRAFFANLRAGAYERGGSTITQQIAKNLFLSRERTLRRKLREAILAWRLEGALSKEQILEIYLNIAEWGEGIAGAEAASRFYFGKSAADLSWAEAALLAGILPNPHRFNPLRAPLEAMRLRQVVLLKLLDSGQITPQEYKEAASTPWRGVLPPRSVEPAAGKDHQVSHLSFEGKK